jgi:chaperonin GroES
MEKIYPIRDRVAVSPLADPETSPGGILIPQNAQDKPTKGKVLAVGPGRVTDDGWEEMSVEVGQTVLYGKYAGAVMTLNGQPVVILREDEILGIIRDEPED